MIRSYSVIVIASFHFVALAGTYKWVDENGVTQYGDTLPPQYSNGNTTKLNKRGQVINKSERILTAVEVRAQEAERAQHTALQAQQAEEQRKRQILLATFASEQEIDLARDRALEPLEGRINVAQQQARSAQARSHDVQKDIDSIKNAKQTSKGKGLPPHLLREQERMQLQLKTLRDSIAKTQLEQQASVARYAESKLRFREAKLGEVVAVSQPSTNSVKPSVKKPTPRLVRACFEKWQQPAGSNGQRAYVVFAEVKRERESEELNLYARVRNQSGEFQTAQFACPLKGDGGMDEAATDARKKSSAWRG